MITTLTKPIRKSAFCVLISSFIFLSTKIGYSQCTDVPVEDAVRNGDFESGYLTGTGTSHDFTAGSDFDFQSDFSFLGGVPNYPTAACTYGMGDKYGVMRGESFTCASTPYTDNTYWGISYGGDQNFQDHTYGASQNGFALVVDYNTGGGIVTPAGYKPAAWEQTVDIYPSQNYYFTAYVANFSSGTAPQIQVRVTPYRQSDGVADPDVILPATGTPSGLMNWQQIYSQWTPAGVYDRVKLRLEFVNLSGGSSGLDVAIDDISFINSCQNIVGNTVPDFGFDEVSVCSEANGDITLNANYPTSGNETFVWYEGTGSTQNQISGATSTTYTTNTPGTYRVCVQDPDNSCAVSDQAVLTTDFEINIEDTELCNPAVVDLDATPTPSTGTPITYDWTVPSGATDPGNSSTVSANIAGTYCVEVTGPSYDGGTCTTNDCANITSLLPTAPTGLEYCSGSTASLEVGDGNDWRWCHDSNCDSVYGIESGSPVVWDAPAATGVKTVYLQSANTTPIAGGSDFGPNFSGAIASTASTSITTSITVDQTLSIASVDMSIEKWTGDPSGTCRTLGNGTENVTIELLDASNTVIKSEDVQVACGSTNTITLDWLLTQGTYTMRATSSGRFQSKADWSAPLETFDLTDYFHITDYSTSSYLGAFGNFNLELSAACEPIPVEVESIACCSNDKPTAENDKEICEGEPLELNASSTEADPTYFWTGPGLTGEQSTTASMLTVTSTITAADTGWYYVYITSVSCSAESELDSVHIGMNPLPDDAGNITPTDAICLGSSETYSISAVTNATSYTWTSASNTSNDASTDASLEVTFNSGTSAIIEVTPVNSCGTGESSQVTITINDIPTGTGTIVSADSICAGDNENVTVTGISNADDYTWFVTSDATNNGSNTNTELIVAGTSNFTIKVVPENECGESDTIFKNLIVDSITQDAGTITGTTNICDDQSNESYSIDPVTGTDVEYNWSISPSTGTITTDTKTTNIVVDFGSSSSYTIEVEPVGKCGTGNKSSITVTNSGSVTADITIQQVPQPNCADEDAMVVATLVGGGTAPDIQWYLNNSPTGTSNDTLILPASSVVDNDEVYAIFLGSDLSCAVGFPRPSNKVNLDIQEEPDNATIDQNDINTCADEEQLTAQAIAIGTGTWSIGSGSATINSSGLVAGLVAGETTKIYYTVSTGTACVNSIDSVEITRLSELTTPDAGTNDTICVSNSDPILSGTAPTSGVTATWSAEGPASIDANSGQTSSLEIGANKFYFTFDNGVCTNVDSVYLVVDAEPTNVSLSSPITTCNGTIPLTAATPTIGEGFWVVETQPGTSAIVADNTNPTSNITGLETGTTTLSWTVSNGKCVASPLTLTINKLANVTTPQITIDGGEFTDEDKTNGSAGVCISNNYSVQGVSPNTTNGESAIWSIVSGTSVTINENDNQTQNLQLNSSGPTTLKWSISSSIAGCTANEAEIDIVVFDEPSDAQAENVEVCFSDGELDATTPSPGVGYWQVQSGTITIEDTLDESSSFTDLTDGGTATLKWVVTTGAVCPDRETTISVSSKGIIIPDVILTASDSIICFGDNVGFEAQTSLSGTVGFLWSVNGTTQTEFTKNFSTNSLLDGQTVMVTVTTADICASPPFASDSITIAVKNQPVPYLDQTSTTVCETNSFDMNVVGGSGSTFTWYKDNEIVATGSTVTIDDFSDAGEYYVVEDNGVCASVSTSPITIGVDQQPKVILGESVSVYAGEGIDLEGTVNIPGVAVEWTADNGAFSDPNSLATVYTPTTGGYVTVTLTANNNSCSDSDNILVKVYEPVYVPNVFSPNDDSENDTWVITGLEAYPAAVLRVFNRWGGPVHTGLGDDDAWSGRNNGNPLPVGTYYYVLDLGEPDVPVLNGTVSIIR